MAQPDHALFHQGQDAFERGEGVLSCPCGTLLKGRACPGLRVGMKLDAMRLGSTLLHPFSTSRG